MRNPAQIDVQRDVHPDGTESVTTSFELQGELRPVDDAVVHAFDEALGALGDGSEVMHAIDPTRLLSFTEGGPAVWSVGMVHVGGTKPYTLLLTYGLSHALSPEAFREGIAHEYSLAVPDGCPVAPWADALLRHLTRYVLDRADLQVGDVMPLWVPITCSPFPPQHHASMPSTSLVGIAVATDPVLPSIATPCGDVEVRRIVGIAQDELDRIETWSVSAFMEEFRSRIDPLLLSDLDRRSAIDDEVFARVATARAAGEGSTCPAFLVDPLRWSVSGQALTVDFAPESVPKIVQGIEGRIPFGRDLALVTRGPMAVVFRPGPRYGITFEHDAALVHGNLDDARFAAITDQLRAGRSRITLPLT